jgi:23S rRNA (guanosine2251-2'-O)-methyltransferase
MKLQSEYIFGLHAVQQLFENEIQHVLELWAQSGSPNQRLQRLVQQAQQQGIAIHWVAKKTLDKLTDQGHHQGVLIRCRARPTPLQLSLPDYLASLPVPPFLLVLDEVQDPHNLGACLRTADAAGIHAVIIPKNRACHLSAIVRKVACGAADNIPLIQVTNLARTLTWLREQGVWLVGADALSETSLFDTKLTGALALVLGAEGHGLRRLTQEACDVLVHIPMLGKVHSLNVSVATGICLYEALRQRLGSR